ncbi:hypothetical protein FH972_023822 [Carpinus fangiana]|uniref:Uncharacterized protein n=1 Tax=Carpinus fangiana TaxID=176857 RepID=A0A5N6KWY6_9ROSI|nr:hypothetical protein FH972_023822 [Carpinus fangiana]
MRHALLLHNLLRHEQQPARPHQHLLILHLITHRHILVCGNQHRQRRHLPTPHALPDAQLDAHILRSVVDPDDALVRGRRRVPIARLTRRERGRSAARAPRQPVTPQAQHAVGDGVHGGEQAAARSWRDERGDGADLAEQLCGVEVDGLAHERVRGQVLAEGGAGVAVVGVDLGLAPWGGRAGGAGACGGGEGAGGMERGVGAGGGGGGGGEGCVRGGGAVGGGGVGVGAAAGDVAGGVFGGVAGLGLG